MRWVITNDHFAETVSESRVGVGHYKDREVVRAAPSAERAALVERYLSTRENPLPYEFQLLTDDEELIYSGKCGDLATADESHAFAPLDWAMSDAGCTIMKYRKVGENSAWQIL